MSESTSAEPVTGADEDSGAAEDALFEDPAGVLDGALDADDGKPQPPPTH